MTATVLKGALAGLAEGRAADFSAEGAWRTQRSPTPPPKQEQAGLRQPRAAPAAAPSAPTTQGPRRDWGGIPFPPAVCNIFK